MNASHTRAVGAIAMVLSGAVALTGCGSDDDKDEQDKPTPASTTTMTSHAKPSKSSEKAESSPEDAAHPPAEHARPEPRGDGVEDDVVALGGPEALVGDAAERPEVAPVDGAPASPEDEAAIRDLVQGYYGFGPDAKVKDMTDYIVDNTCSELNEKAGGREQYEAVPIPDVRLQDWPGYPGEVGVDVSEVEVAGDVASAVSTVHIEGSGDDVQRMRFARDDGRWTFCDR